MNFSEETWSAFCFILCFLTLYRPIKKAVKEWLSGEVKKISTQLQSLQTTKQNTLELLRAVEAKNAQLPAIEQETLAATRQQVEILIAHRQEQLNQMLSQQEEIFQQDIQNFRNQLASQLQSELMRAACKVIEAYLKANFKLTPADYQIAMQVLHGANGTISATNTLPSTSL